MYQIFKGTQLKPTGWLRRQLEIQADGLSGNLHKMWRDVKDTKWIGGEGDGWERAPYWLDGFIPLAYLLGDEERIKTADMYINTIIDRQREDGWICPCEEEHIPAYDAWAYLLICKALSVYCEMTGSQKAEDALYRALKCLHGYMANGTVKLFSWGQNRWYEGLISLIYLKDKYDDEWITDLGKILREQGIVPEELSEYWKHPIHCWQMCTHIVNICMMLKFEAVSCKLFGEKYTGRAEKLWELLEKNHGTAVGIFTGDESLGGVNNNRGTELCAVVELMFTCEELYKITGKAIWAERLDMIYSNALCATFLDDMWTHQYDQMANQIACVKIQGKPIFGNNNGSAHLFGLEPNFGCCTVNFNQGWPKFARNIFLKSKKGVLAAYIAPSQLDTEIKGANVSITADTEFPFRMNCTYKIKTDKPAAFEFKIRIPAFSKAFTVNGERIENKKYYTVSKVWEGEEEINIVFEDTPHFISRPHNLKAVKYGNLVFSLPIDIEYKMYEYEENGVERKFPYCDYELYPKSEWNYGLSADKNGNVPLEVVCLDGDDIPFSSKNPRIGIKTKVVPINWGYEIGYNTVSAYKPNERKALGEEKDMMLIPYACAKLRMTELPIIKKK